MRTLIKFTGLCVLFFAGITSAAAQQQSAAEHVAALKASLAASQAILQQYEWIETTTVSFKGEEKSRQQNRCYYGADGGVQKVLLSAPPTPAKKRGVRGRIAANKKEELTDDMKEAVALVKSYVPPSPGNVQMAKDAGKVSVDLLQPGKLVRLNFRDYLKAGDTLSVEVDLASNRLTGLKVKSYLDNARDAVSLDARMASLNDGTTYADAITLDAPAKKLRVVVDNSGYRKTSN